MITLKCPKCGKVGMVYKENLYRCCKCGHEEYYRSQKMELIWKQYVIINDIHCPKCNTTNLEPCFRDEKSNDWYCNHCRKWFDEGHSTLVTSVTVEKPL